MKTLKWTVEFIVKPSVIENGFTLTKDELRDMFEEHVGCHADEFAVKIVDRPFAHEIEAIRRGEAE